jgi:predicted metalloprotease with PDZ domain
VVDYTRLLARAGFVLRPAASGRGFIGAIPLRDGTRGVRIAAAVPFGSPAYAAGLERDDMIASIGGTRVTRADEVDRAITSRKPGESVQVAFERRGESVTSTIRLGEDPRRMLVPAEQAGQPLSDAQRRFREAWLSSAARNTF